MEKYTYLLLCMAVLLVLGALLLFRKDIAKASLKFGLLGGIAGFIAEFFYFRDYWRPPSLMGTARISLEDFLFGFGIAAVTLALYPVVSRTKYIAGNIPRQASRKKIYGIFLLGGFVTLICLNLFMGINSIFVTSGIFIAGAVVMLVIRRDLLTIALVSALLLTVFALVIYLLLFNILVPDFWDKYWMLVGTRWGVTIFGNVPLTELIWYFSWALFGSVSYPFVTGARVAERP